MCTADTCGLATHRCENRPIEGCCRHDDECATANPCTRDSCTLATNTCAHDPVDGCCRNDDDRGSCEKCSGENICVADRAKDGASCTFDSAQGACCNGDCAVCAEDETLDLESCGCGGGSVCVCTKADLGDPCANHVDCCSGLCAYGSRNEGRCVDPEVYLETPFYCAPAGAFCINVNDDNAVYNRCCGGVCTNCVCEGEVFICREVGDPDCGDDRACCGHAVCVPSGCCLEPGVPCSATGECCSGARVDLFGDGDLYCACGAAGSPCTNGTHCCGEDRGPEGVCA